MKYISLLISLSLGLVAPAFGQSLVEGKNAAGSTRTQNPVIVGGADSDGLTRVLRVNADGTLSLTLSALPAGTAIIGKVAIDQTTPGTTNGVTVLNFPGTTNVGSGNIGGFTASVSPSLAVSTSAYVAGYVVGGKLTLTSAMRSSGGTGVLQSMLLIDQSNQKAAVDVLIFDSDPSNGTYTDHAAFTFNASDVPKLIRRVSIAASDYVTVGGVATAEISPGGRVLKANGSANLYAIIVTSGTPTYTNAAHLTLRVGILQD